jgi:hypothetical protein
MGDNLVTVLNNCSLPVLFQFFVWGFVMRY